MRTVRRRAHARVTVERRKSVPQQENSRKDGGKTRRLSNGRWPPGVSGNPSQRFKKGEVANPNGRPKKEVCITTLIKEFLEETDGHTGKTWAQLVAEAVTKGSAQLNKTAMKELLSRVDGPIKQKIEIQMPEPFIVEVEEVGPDEPVRTTVSRRRRKG